MNGSCQCSKGGTCDCGVYAIPERFEPAEDPSPWLGPAMGVAVLVLVGVVAFLAAVAPEMW